MGGGLSESLSVRAAVQYNDREGYLSDGYDDQDSIATRLSALWKGDKTSLLVTGEYADVDSQGEATVKRSTLTPVPSDAWTGPSVGNAQQPPTAFIPGGTRILDDGFNDIRVAALSAQLDIDLGPATLTFLPAYRDTEAAYLTYTPGFHFRTDETSKQQRYELQLGNSSESLKWVGGLYYFDEDQTQIYNLRGRPIQEGTVNTPLRTRSYAAFGEVTFGVTDTVRLIGGLRYSNDEKRQAGFTQPVLPTAATTNNSGEREFDDLSWKAGVEYDLSPQNMLFLTAATGFKAGGFFPSVPAPNNSFEPEELTAFTLGSRNRFLDGTLQLNFESFLWKYRDKQERYLGATPAGNLGYEPLFGLANSSTIRASLDAQFASGQFLSPDFIQPGRDDGYVALNANVAFEAPGEWIVAVWGRNLSDEEIYTGGGRYAFSRPVVAGGDPTLFYANIRAPRTYGLSISKRF